MLSDRTLPQINKIGFPCLSTLSFTIFLTLIITVFLYKSDICTAQVALPADGIMDNGSQWTSSSTTWEPSAGSNPYGDGSLYRKGSGNYGYEASDVNGSKEVSLWWTEYYSRCNSIPVDIYDGNTLIDTVYVNHLANGGKWNSLGTYSFNGTVKVAVNSQAGCSTSADAVKIAPSNNAPVLTPIGNKSVKEGNILSFTVSAIDDEGDTLTYTAENLPLGALFDQSTNTFTWPPAYDQSGPYPVTFLVSDGNNIDTESITISVTNTNRPPVLDPIASIAVTEGATISINPTATDSDGDNLTFTYSGGIVKFPYTTSCLDAGVYTVRVTVSDGLLTDYRDVIIRVLNSNCLPVLNHIADITVNEGDTISFNPTANDPDGDTLTFSYSGWMSSSNYTTSYFDEGVHTVTVTISDGSLTDSQDVAVTVNDGTAQVAFEWAPNTEENLVGYNLYVGRSTGTYDYHVEVGNQTAYTISGLVKGIRYYFALTAYESQNESDFSEELDVYIPVQ
ncbi:MAG: hypothetical protein GY941_14250 [Planctomycetes bacterium]|nr:hypothetical protein [Planctomycetota bacterium]